MKSVRRLAAVLALLFSAPLVAHAAGARVIVKYKDDSELLRKQALAAGPETAGRAQALGQRIGVALAAGHALGERSQVVFASGMTSEALAERLAQEGDVEYAVPDRRKRIVAAPNDPRYLSVPLPSGPVSGQWYLRAPAGEVRSAINAEAAWDVTTGSSSVVVAVVDTGIRSDHPEFVGKLVPGYDMIADIDTANDANGRDADPSDAGDWLDQADIDSGDFSPCTSDDISDSSWHGTEVAGIVAATTDNGAGMASVGRNVRVLPVRALGKCGGFDSDIIAGMRWAAGLSVSGVPANANPAKVINLSLGGGTGCSAPYRDAVTAITARGAAIVVSAGNGAGGAVSEPAACAGVIAVAGLRHIGTKVGFSDLGPEVTISAPGGNCVNTSASQPCLFPILTTTNSGTKAPVSTAAGGSIYSDGSSRLTLGTSFSAPLVAGAAALIQSARSSITPAQVRDLIRATSTPFPTSGADAGTPQCAAPSGTEQLECYCTTSTCGAGMLNAGAALARVLNEDGIVANIVQSNADPVVGTTVTLDASGSKLVSGSAGIASYSWTVVDDGDDVVNGFSSATNAAVASLATLKAGKFIVRATVTSADSPARQASATATVFVRGAASSPPPSGGGGGGGGGSLSAAWLLLLSLALLALRRAPRPARVRR